jgi:hypothetical protein
MTNTWFVMIPPGYANKSTSEKELRDFVIQYPAGSKAWDDANAGRIVQGAEGNTGNPQVSEQLIKWQGPFATLAQAHAAANPQQQSPNPANDLINAAENSTGILGTLAGFLGVPGHISGTNLVIRATKIIIGAVLLIYGITHLTGADNAVANTVKKLPLPI